MTEQTTISQSTTTFGESFFMELENKAITPDIHSDHFTFEDADEELVEVSKFIMRHFPSKSELELSRIKFLYADKPKKEGGKYGVGYIVPRTEIERAVDDRYDYIVCVYYHTWKNLDIKHKVIQLDKILCGVLVEFSTEGEKRVKKNVTDTREFKENIDNFGAEEVLNSSEIINLAVRTEVERQKNIKKNG